MNKNFWYILAIGVLLCFLSWYFLPPVNGYESIQQGGTVYLNDTVDISGVAAGYSQLVYINKWSTWLSPDNESITYTINLPQQKIGYFNFYVDPKIFKDRLGYWYRYNGVFEENANNRAFYVVADRPVMNVSINMSGNETVVVVPQPPKVEERHIADYLVARGDPLYVSFTNNTPASAWIFGRKDGIFNREVVNGIANFNATEISELEPGAYTLLYYSPGNDQKFDVRVVGDKLEYFDSAEFKVVSVDIEGLSPSLVLDKILQTTDYVDDTFTTFKLEVQNPSIEVTEVEVVEVSDLTAVLQMQGYTNLKYNSELIFVLDEDKTNARTIKEWNTIAKAVGNPGSFRYFELSVPVVWKSLAVGEHHITAHTPTGETMSVPFWVYDLPGGVQKPNQTVKYVAGNLFVPTPTPEIKIVEVTRDVIKTVTVVTVQTVDYNLLAKEQVNQSIPLIASYILWGVVLGLPLLYLVWVALRAVYRMLNKKEKEGGK